MGLVAVITGASSGIGSATAKLLSSMYLLINVRDRDNAIGGGEDDVKSYQGITSIQLMSKIM